MFGKRLVGFLCAACVAFDVWALDIQVSDPGFQSCLEQLQKERGWSSLEEVTDIQCHDRGIQSLEGVERFSRLERLSLYNNAIARARVSGLSRLKHLNLARNNLKAITLSELPRLEELYLFRNRIEQLLLEDLPALVLLRANSNRMLRFDYQSLPALKKIYLFDNELETIDIHNLPVLEYMDVRENPMPDKLYEDMDRMTHTTILHDGNADDW